ncbi:MAG: hypothetical protein HQL07_14675 [Nitrospirae bacterium]|nr:hypothetical protein [Magnetococcales bacterium]HAT51578.1 hypothetical protein [Alphaproteobacteria bacterium]
MTQEDESPKDTEGVGPKSPEPTQTQATKFQTGAKEEGDLGADSPRGQDQEPNGEKPPESPSGSRQEGEKKEKNTQDINSGDYSRNTQFQQRIKADFVFLQNKLGAETADNEPDAKQKALRDHLSPLDFGLLNPDWSPKDLAKMMKSIAEERLLILSSSDQGRSLDVARRILSGIHRVSAYEVNFYSINRSNYNLNDLLDLDYGDKDSCKALVVDNHTDPNFVGTIYMDNLTNVDQIKKKLKDGNRFILCRVHPNHLETVVHSGKKIYINIFDLDAHETTEARQFSEVIISPKQSQSKSDNRLQKIVGSETMNREICRTVCYIAVQFPNLSFEEFQSLVASLLPDGDIPTPQETYATLQWPSEGKSYQKGWEQNMESYINHCQLEWKHSNGLRFMGFKESDLELEFRHYFNNDQPVFLHNLFAIIRQRRLLLDFSSETVADHLIRIYRERIAATAAIPVVNQWLIDVLPTRDSGQQIWGRFNQLLKELNQHHLESSVDYLLRYLSKEAPYQGILLHYIKQFGHSAKIDAKVWFVELLKGSSDSLQAEAYNGLLAYLKGNPNKIFENCHYISSLVPAFHQGDVEMSVVQRMLSQIIFDFSAAVVFGTPVGKYGQKTLGICFFSRKDTAENELLTLLSGWLLMAEYHFRSMEKEERISHILLFLGLVVDRYDIEDEIDQFIIFIVSLIEEDETHSILKAIDHHQPQIEKSNIYLQMFASVLDVTKGNPSLILRFCIAVIVYKWFLMIHGLESSGSNLSNQAEVLEKFNQMLHHMVSQAKKEVVPLRNWPVTMMRAIFSIIQSYRRIPVNAVDSEKFRQMAVREKLVKRLIAHIRGAMS